MAARYLRWLLDATGNDQRLAIAAYHQGLRSVQELGIEVETWHYVEAVTALRSRF